MTIAVGFFDGVHLGHQAILRGADAALTFVDHPMTVLSPEWTPQLIMTYDERVRTILECGVREVRSLAFTPELAALSPDEFACRYLGRGNRVRCGANWRFGAGGAGDAKWLEANGYEVEVVPYAEFNGMAISSSRIRKALAAGEIEDAEAMLGRPVVIRGEVVQGKGVGRKIGYPTINLRKGVYAARVKDEKAIVNYGTAPTMGDLSWSEPVMEVHLLKFLRDERKFASVEELKNQIAKDVREV